MTEAEINKALALAQHHLGRIRTLEARMIDTQTPRTRYPGIVPDLCEVIIELARELKAQRRSAA